MLRLALRRARIRFVIGACIALTLPLWLPAAPSDRLWTLTGLALLAPWLVLGRDAAARRGGWRMAMAEAPRAGQLLVLELLPAALVVLLGAFIGTGGAMAPTLALTGWGLLLVCAADALDRRLGAAGPAWVAVLALGLAIYVAPLWLAFAFGAVDWAPWLATLSIGLHPTATALAAAGQSTLQDPIFYTFTLSGVVEVRPLAWGWGAAAFVMGALACIALAIRATRRVSGIALPLGSTT